jgi:hypothetical protein
VYNNNTNFCIRDDRKLIQPTVSPTNTLIGYFVSKQREIILIFLSKFEDIFRKVGSVDGFIEEHPELGLEALSFHQKAMLCIL